MVDKKAREMGVESLALLVMLVAVAVAARAPFEEEGPGSGGRENQSGRISKELCKNIPANFRESLSKCSASYPKNAL